MAGPTALGTNDLMILLALMRLDNEAYGVPIVRELEESVGHVVAIASVYASLDRLLKRGLVKSELGEPTAERGGRAKKYFRITHKGLGEVRSARRSLIELWKSLPDLRGA